MGGWLDSVRLAVAEPLQNASVIVGSGLKLAPGSSRTRRTSRTGGVAGCTCSAAWRTTFSLPAVTLIWMGARPQASVASAL